MHRGFNILYITCDTPIGPETIHMEVATAHIEAAISHTEDMKAPTGDATYHIVPVQYSQRLKSLHIGCNSSHIG